MNPAVEKQASQFRTSLLAEKDRLDAESQRIDGMLKAIDGASGQPTLVAPGRKTRKLSQAVKNRIAAAQRARWANLKANKKKTSKAA